jgi:hypothetical protein
VAESCSAELGSSVLSDSDLMSYIDVVEGVVDEEGYVVEVDTGYRGLSVDQCQAVSTSTTYPSSSTTPSTTSM